MAETCWMLIYMEHLLYFCRVFLCFIPCLFMSRCKDMVHYCPECKREIGRFNRDRFRPFKPTPSTNSAASTFVPEISYSGKSKDSTDDDKAKDAWVHCIATGTTFTFYSHIFYIISHFPTCTASLYYNKVIKILLTFKRWWYLWKNMLNVHRFSCLYIKLFSINRLVGVYNIGRLRIWAINMSILYIKIYSCFSTVLYIFMIFLCFTDIN